MLIVNRYEPTGPIANGGMGDVIQCRDTHLDRQVIIKSLQAGVAAARLLDEQRALSKLRSKHVVQLFDIVEIAGPFGLSKALVLEFIEGQDLQYAGFIVDYEYLKIIWQIANGLNDIHAAGVIHRDLKPNNIRLDVEGVVKILDFGLARSVGADDQTHSIIGTPAFMAPELWGNSIISFSTAIDTYAFGITALMLLTVNLPAPLRAQPPQPVSKPQVETLLTGLPQDLIDLVFACISYRPNDRPSMNEVASALERHLLFNKHRAIAVINHDPKTLDANSSIITMNVGLDKSLSINYNGHNFLVNNVLGPVYINNASARIGTIIPGCCVITFGNQGGPRTFVTFDISNPEVLA